MYSDIDFQLIMSTIETSVLHLAPPAPQPAPVNGGTAPVPLQRPRQPPRHHFPPEVTPAPKGGMADEAAAGDASEDDELAGTPPDAYGTARL